MSSLNWTSSPDPFDNLFIVVGGFAAYNNKEETDMTHPLVHQLRFTRSEFQRGLVGLGDVEARQRFLPMNCISWNIGHLAWQEQRYWLMRGQGVILLPELNELVGYGCPPSTPPLSEMWAAWNKITQAADPWLDELTSARLQEPALVDGQPGPLFGTLLYRTIYHYWYHTGENLAIRQALGHQDLPQFVGDIDAQAPYMPAE